MSLENIDFCFQKILSLYKDKELSVSDWIALVTSIMEIVEDVPDLSGPEKKELVIAVTSKTIDTLVKDEDTKRELQYLLNSSVPFFIDVIVMATKKILNINKIKKCGLFSCLK